MNKSINNKIVDWIIGRVKKKYSNDIAMILLYGSFINGTSNDKSDVDCYFIPKTENGYQFAVDFILNGIGYDIFPMNWERVENIANLNESILPCVGDVKVLFYSTNEDLERFTRLQDRLLLNLQDKEYTQKIAKKRFHSACELYTQMKVCNKITDVRRLAGSIIMVMAEAIALYNQDYYHFGLKNQYENLKKFGVIPENFLEEYINVIKAEDKTKCIEHCYQLLKSTGEYIGWELIVNEIKERKKDNIKSKIDCACLANFYEEASSTFNKIYVCAESKNYILAFLSAVCIQNDLYEFSQEYNMQYYDILSSYSYSDLTALINTTKKIESELIQFIISAGGHIKSFNSFEDFEQADL